ncbi:MAG: ShlB/FhaC/HecB family hemolysin secretion/activation protein [Verrucomicrobiales bacterium]|nr:ShlB/FhaC/HecB family hemolysin secretion/activation protein [Verrucomicrobiales bacterium]
MLAFCLPAFGQTGNRPVEKARDRQEEAFASAKPAEGPDAAPPETEAPMSSDDYTPFGVDLGAIVLLSHQDQAEPVDPAVPGKKLTIDPEIEMPAGLEEKLGEFLGKPVSAGLLSDLAKEIILAWRESDYPLVDVYFPEQNITEGKIQIVTRESVLGEIRVENARHSRVTYLRNQIGLQPGDRINQRTVRAGLDWIIENPIRTVNLIYDKGTVDGTSDITLQVQEKRPFSVYSGFAYTGVNFTGQNEFSAGFQLMNPLKTEQTISYNYNADIDFDHLEAHTVFYETFLPWRHKLRLIGAYVSSEVASDDLVLPLDLMGENIQGTGEYEIPLPRCRSGLLEEMRHSVQFGLDYKSTNTNLIFGGLDIFDSNAVVFQYRIGYEATLPDKIGYTRVSLSSVWAPGSVLQDNDDAAFEALREGSTADYWYGIAELERGFRLPADFSLVLRSTGQTTGARLISTEQVLAGGYRTVRGFDENQARGDSGAILNVELISPQFSVLPAIDDQWNLLGFYDGAFLQVSDAMGGVPNPALQSAGIGVQLRIRENVFARGAYGWVIDTHGLEEVDINDGKMHFGVTVRY